MHHVFILSPVRAHVILFVKGRKALHELCSSLSLVEEKGLLWGSFVVLLCFHQEALDSLIIVGWLQGRIFPPLDSVQYYC